MNFDSVIDLKRRALDALAGPPAGPTGLQASAAAAPGRRMAVGYSRHGPGDYRLELRPHRDDRRARRVADEFRRVSPTEVQVETVPRVEMPSRARLRALAGRRAEAGPLRLGSSVGHLEGGAGSLGAFVATAEHGVCLLGCSHVLALLGAASPGVDRVYHPGYPDKDPLLDDDAVAVFASSVRVSRRNANRMDCAVATLTDFWKGHHLGNRLPPGVPGAGEALSTYRGRPQDVQAGAAVAKVGKATGVTRGAVTGVFSAVTVHAPGGPLLFDEVYEVRGEGGRPFTADGDSGSLVYFEDGLEAFGLHFAAIDGGGTAASYACRLDSVLAAFDAELLE